MSFESICILLLVVALFLMAPVAWADGVDDLPDDTTDTEPTETAPAPTVAPFDFVLLEESSVKAVQRLDELKDVLSGSLFFLGVLSGMVFFKVLADRIRTV